MSKIGRNDPCPCGSGKKYKHCCAAKETESQEQIPPDNEERSAVYTALNWLDKRHESAATEAISVNFFGDKVKEFEKFTRLAPGLQTMLQININEWLLADATLDLGKKEVRVIDLVLGQGGPALTPRGREHLETLASSPLRLYEVQEVQKGRGIVLSDMLDEDREPFFVHEVKGTESLVRWDIIGARCMLHDGKYTLGGGIYPLSRDNAARCLTSLSKKPKIHPQKFPTRTICTEAIVECWLDSLISPPAVPFLIDQQTRESILFVTDIYTVSDWPALERILLEQPDIEVEEEGKVWTHIEPIDEKQYRSLARLERVSGNDTLEMECRTRGRADEARKWLEGIAGQLLRRKRRKTEDPRQALLSGKKQRRLPPQEELPKEVQEQVIHESLAQHYEQWLSMSIPALNGKTPSEAAKLDSLRPTLIDLLKRIEQIEARRSKEDGIALFDTSFLWDRLHIARGG